MWDWAPRIAPEPPMQRIIGKWEGLCKGGDIFDVAREGAATNGMVIGVKGSMPFRCKVG